MANTPNTDLGELLLRPREALDIEVKGWLDLADDNQRADLCKAILAVANHGGGYVILGIAEDGGGQFSPDPKRPSDLSGLTQDDVQNAILKYLEPAIQCRTEHVEHPEAQDRFPIVVVPGGHRVPIKAKRGSPDGKLVKDRIYIRRPGPRSEEPQNPAEWDELLERCLRARKDELLIGIRDLLAGEVPRAPLQEATVPARLKTFIRSARERWDQLVAPLAKTSSARFPLGYYEAGLAIDGAITSHNPAEFRELLQGSLKNHSGWPPFPYFNRDPYRPRLVDGAIESWHGPDADGSVDAPAHCDFWRVSPDGYFFTRRGYNEDGGVKQIQPGTTFDITTPTWRIGEIIMQAYYVATALSAAGNFVGEFKWAGLTGRKLVSVGNPNRALFDNHVAHQSSYVSTIRVPMTSIASSLPEIVFSILQPLYLLFDFWQLPKRLVEQELQSLLRQRF